MGLMITDAETVETIRRLALESGSTAEDVVRRAMEAESKRDERTRQRMAVVRDLQESWAQVPKSGLKADKAFFDDLGGGL